ncbi:MAG: carbohydrate porin [Desulfobulbia bacterium]
MAQSTAANQASISSGPSSRVIFDEAIDKTDAEAEFDATGWPPKGRFTVSPRATQAYVDFNKRLWTDFGMVYVLAPTAMLQKGTQGGKQDYTANGQYQGLFAWRLLNKTRIGTGYFVANNLKVKQWTDTTGVDFSQSLGINYFSSDSVGDVDVVKALLWRHDFPGDILTMWIGHDEIGALDGGCSYLCDDTSSFISSPLSNNPTRTLPGQGGMLSAEVQLFNNVFLDAAIADARGNGQVNFSRLSHEEYAYAGALTVRDPFATRGDGFYRLTYYRVDETYKGTSRQQAATEGISIQMEQDIGDVGFTTRYSQTFKRKGSIDKTAAVGLVWKKPFGNDEDWLGLGFGWVRPTAASTNDEYVAETYYRMQLTPFLQLTPGAMLIINPSNNPNNNTEGVFNVRLRGHF